MTCEHDCARDPAFPRAIFNRPGLDAIDYRIGDYIAMRAHILAQIDGDPALAGWTHRLPDDPGIALVEAAAIVGDILALYQETYANEAYLRTAQWRDSVAELVRVLSYRLAPGLGGRARFALAVKGDRPVTIPKGFAITAKLPSAPKPAQFETTAAFEARPALSKFHLYRPRFVPQIVNGSDTFQLDAGNDLALAKGDRLLVGTADGTTLTHTQILIVEKVWEAFGIRHVKTSGRIASLLGGRVFAPVATPLASVSSALVSAALPLLSAPAPMLLSAPLVPLGPLTLRPSAGVLSGGLSFLPAFSGVLGAGLGLALLGSAASLQAYKIGASVRHFGHNAPATRVAIDANGHASEVGVSYVRRLNANQGDPAGPALRPQQWPLEGEVAAFSAGTRVLVEANLSADASGAPARKRVLERGVSQVDRQSLAWGSLTGASTVLQLDDDVAIAESGTTLASADIRGITVHQVVGTGFRIRAASQPTGAASGHSLDYFGSRADALALVDRTLLLGLASGPRAVQVQAVDAGGGADPRFHALTLDASVRLADFDHDTPSVDVYGNLVDTTEGKSEVDAPIGDGDARESFQTFALPKAPLTYLLDTASVPPQLPELEIRVGGVLWRRVASLFARGPREPIYIVREDADGKSFVQFGDGRTGARLPSGRGNVVAHWRTGSGAHGLPAGADKPSAAKRLPGFDDLWMLEPATGGAAPESAAHARLAAPTTMQSLGRIVSLADFEAEALSLPGVLKARAAWQVQDGAPLVVLTVLCASAEPADAAAIDLALRRALAARGPARWPLAVRNGSRQRILIGLAVAADPSLRSEDIALAIAAALGVEDDDPADDLDLGARGLMHWRMRNFGDGVHGSQILAAVQNVAGVRWVEIERLQIAPVALTLGVAAPALAPVLLAPSPVLSLGAFARVVPPARRSLRARADQLLSLAQAGLTIRFVADPEEGSS
ncbi:MAG: hypothetical protein ACXWCU_11525 [Caldimonas sp.]